MGLHVLDNLEHVGILAILNSSVSREPPADLWEGDEDSNFSVFRALTVHSSLNGPDLFTELPLL